MSPQVKSALVLLTAMLSFSASGALVKISCADLPFMEVVFGRGVVGALIVAVVALSKGVSLAGKRRGLLFARAAAGTVAMMLFFFALSKIPVADSLLLNQATPVFMLPLAALILKERITRTHILLAALAVVGVTIVIRPGGDVFNLPGMLALLSAFFAAWAYILVRKLTATEHTLTIVFWFTSVSALGAAPFMICDFVVPEPKTLLAVLTVGLTGLGGQLLLTKAYSFGEAGKLAVIGSLGAILGAGWDLLLWRHVPDMWTAVGGGVTIFACATIQRLRTAPKPGGGR